MSVKIDESWKKLLKSEFNSEYFKKLISFIKEEYSVFRCYPKGSEIFNAFDCCPINKLKVVVIGQDPYHGTNQANGLCFSVNKGISHPPSLINIFKEIEGDLNFKFENSNGDLSKWANQGVMLLNATLTVREGIAGSHQNKGWESFTNKVISRISELKEGVIFLLWGKSAQQKQKLIDKNKHHILTSSHPSPLSSYRGFLGCGHFSRCNQILKQQNNTEINWEL